jgi:hypothetical protein
MADRYWVGGTTAWNGAVGLKWSDTSGGAGGASLPTINDDVFFDGASGTVNCTISTGNTGAKSINCTGFTGTLSGSSAITIAGSVTLVTGMTFSHAGIKTITDNATITSASKTFGPLVIDAPSATVQMADALLVNSTFTLTNGTFTTNSYALTNISVFTATSNNSCTLNLGASTVSITGTTPQFSGSGLTLNAGTSLIICSSSGTFTFNGGGNTFYDVRFSSTSSSSRQVFGPSTTFNTLEIIAPATSGGNSYTLFQNNTTIGTLIANSSGGNAARRIILQSNPVDFLNIIGAGAASWTGTRLGDLKFNSGITFSTPKTVYYNLVTGGNAAWGTAAAWATTPSGTPDQSNYPLAQDTAAFTDSGGVPTGDITNASGDRYVGTIDLSARTSAVRLNLGGNFYLYGNLISGSGVTYSGASVFRFVGQNSQTITSAGKTISYSMTVQSPGGTVTLLDAMTLSSNGPLNINEGTFSAGTYNVTTTSITSTINSATSNVRTVDFGSGTWTLGGILNFSTATNLTVTGSGTISMIRSTTKTFQGGGVQTYPTLNQGGAGELRITGSNKFADITNTYRFTGATSVSFESGTTNEFTAFNLTGLSGAVCTLGAINNTAQANLKKATVWYMGANSTDAGNNSNLTFTAGDGVDYLSVSYINGIPGLSGGNFFMLFN